MGLHHEPKRWRFYRWLAFKLPTPVVYHAAIRLIAYATVGKYGQTDVSNLPAMEAVKRWEKDKVPKNLH